ncbi:hypothetical protein FGB62_101g04 [Gracilaria domingensis]|nr:hypothetical protein FGB62_101g04 [Gracilaria domingensis]
MESDLKLRPEIQAEIWAFYRMEGNPCTPTVIHQHAIAEFLMLEKKMTPARFVALKKCATNKKGRSKSDYPRPPDILSYCLLKVPKGISPRAASARAVTGLRRRHSDVETSSQGSLSPMDELEFSLPESARSMRKRKSAVQWGVENEIIGLIGDEDVVHDGIEFKNEKPQSHGIKRVRNDVTDLIEDEELGSGVEELTQKSFRGKILDINIKHHLQEDEEDIEQGQVTRQSTKPISALLHLEEMLHSKDMYINNTNARSHGSWAQSIGLTKIKQMRQSLRRLSSKRVRKNGAILLAMRALEKELQKPLAQRKGVCMALGGPPYDLKVMKTLTNLGWRSCEAE